MKPTAPAHQTRPVQIRRIETTEAFQELARPWRACYSQSNADSAFLTWEWLYTWWKIKGGSRQLWLLTAWEENALVGIAPLMLERERYYGLNLRVLRSLGGSDIDAGGFIILEEDPRIIHQLCQSLAKDARHWDMILLNQLPAENTVTQSILANLKNLGMQLHEKHERHLYLPIRGRTWTDYFQSISASLRQDVRKMFRRAEKQGALKYVRYSGGEVTHEHLTTLFALNEHGRYPDLYRPAEEQAFQHALLDETLRNSSCETVVSVALGWPANLCAWLSLLTLDGEPVAYLYGLLYNDRLECWRMGYHSAHHDLAVGKLVLMRVIEDCFGCQYNEMDLLRGDEWYKGRLQVHERPYYWQIRAVPKGKLLPHLAAIAIPELKIWIKARLPKTGQVRALKTPPGG